MGQLGTGRRTTTLIFAQSQNPVGQAEGQIGIAMGVTEPQVGLHNHVALILAPGIFRVALVETVGAHGGGGTERMHVGWAGKLDVGVGQRACHCGARASGG